MREYQDEVVVITQREFCPHTSKRFGVDQTVDVPVLDFFTSLYHFDKRQGLRHYYVCNQLVDELTIYVLAELALAAFKGLHGVFVELQLNHFVLAGLHKK